MISFLHRIVSLSGKSFFYQIMSDFICDIKDFIYKDTHLMV